MAGTPDLQAHDGAPENEHQRAFIITPPPSLFPTPVYSFLKPMPGLSLWLIFPGLRLNFSKKRRADYKALPPLPCAQETLAKFLCRAS